MSVRILQASDTVTRDQSTRAAPTSCFCAGCDGCQLGRGRLRSPPALRVQLYDNSSVRLEWGSVELRMCSLCRAAVMTRSIACFSAVISLRFYALGAR